MQTDNIGIDYGRGMANVDHNNGIHYGVINEREVLQAWADESSPEYVYTCPYCGQEHPQAFVDYLQVGKYKYCQNKKCHKRLTENDFLNIEPSNYTIDNEEYKATCEDDGDIFITQSPYYTTCQYCSPCAPGAGYIMNTVDGGVKAYCFGHDWFEDGKAPYPVYSVETGELVEPNAKQKEEGKSNG